MAKIKDKAAIAARKRDRKAGLLDYTSTVSVKAIPEPNRPKLVATLKTAEENAKHTQQDVVLGLETFNTYSEKDKVVKGSLNSKYLALVLKEAVIEGNFVKVLQVHYTLKQERMAIVNGIQENIRLRKLYEAVDFLVAQFTAGKMRWWIAKSHLNNHFDLGIPVTLPRVNARVGVN